MTLDEKLKKIKGKVAEFEVIAEESASPSAAYVISTLVVFVRTLAAALKECRRQRNNYILAVEEDFKSAMETSQEDDKELLEASKGPTENSHYSEIFKTWRPG